ncbi:lactonase family protein [Flavobacterium sp. J49]|uniref:lactonase family protein n=1 Tax=Flavobacterium sp. J49 TaxID=2718534 RepID=UPI0015939631|nr:lactonase family protein [Flavobacterium sp. J49]MBF6640153.1 lactonase family protein [Flavobacterium sp. J49]NIC01398.1 lactonase family protein [Flavobacterium sp. J49]
MTKFLVLFAALCFSISNQAQHSKVNLFIGTYTKTCDSHGIYLYEFDTYTGEFNVKTSTQNVVNPSFLTVSENKRFIYATNEDGDNSKVSAFQFEANQNQIIFLNSQKSEGNDPCHIINDQKNVVVANYSGGNITVFGKNADGSLGKYKQIIKQEGQTGKETKPLNSHMHMLQLSPDDKYLIASDLGKDYLYVYRYNPEAQSAVLEFSSFVRVKQGAGPRHFTFSANGKYVYLMNELDGSLLVFKYKDGKLDLLQETTVVAKDFKGKTSAADIHISPDGKFLYATNRGDANTISCFEIKKNGKLKWKQTTGTLGKGPRNFSIDPTGSFLLVAHQYTNEVVIFKIDKMTGELTDSGKRIALCSPVCLVFE